MVSTGPFGDARMNKTIMAESLDLTRVPAYRKAYEDVDFLHRDDLRPVRLQLELLKAEIMQQEQNVHSTVVVFGSARTPSPETADAEWEAARQRLEAEPDRPAARAALQRAETRRRH